MGGIFAMGRGFRRSMDEGESMRAIREPLVRLGEIAIECKIRTHLNGIHISLERSSHFI